MPNLEKIIKKSFDRNLSGFKKGLSCPSELELENIWKGDYLPSKGKRWKGIWRIADIVWIYWPRLKG